MWHPCAYLAAVDVAGVQGAGEAESIRQQLQGHLPEYMLPSALIELESFPLKVNGKLDRKALPDPEFKGNENHYVAPRTEQETQLCKIWQQVLGKAECHRPPAE